MTRRWLLSRLPVFAALPWAARVATREAELQWRLEELDRKAAGLQREVADTFGPDAQAAVRAWANSIESNVLPVYRELERCLQRLGQ